MVKKLWMLLPRMAAAFAIFQRSVNEKFGLAMIPRGAVIENKHREDKNGAQSRTVRMFTVHKRDIFYLQRSRKRCDSIPSAPHLFQEALTIIIAF